jgi:hypothetical protein
LVQGGAAHVVVGLQRLGRMLEGEAVDAHCGQHQQLVRFQRLRRELERERPAASHREFEHVSVAAQAVAQRRARVAVLGDGQQREGFVVPQRLGQRAEGAPALRYRRQRHVAVLLQGQARVLDRCAVLLDRRKHDVLVALQARAGVLQQQAVDRHGALHLPLVLPVDSAHVGALRRNLHVLADELEVQRRAPVLELSHAVPHPFLRVARPHGPRVTVVLGLIT